MRFHETATPAIFLGLLGFCMACASAGTRPDDMSAAAHDVEAEAHQRAAAQQEVLAAPTHTEVETRCVGKAAVSGICWTSTRVVTDEHKRIADEHRRIAAEHRAASATLRDAEAKSCTGVDPSDRDLSPFLHREDVARVDPMYTLATIDKSHAANLVGATIEFRDLPGLTRERLQHVIDCHLARNAALGHPATMPDCPLMPRGVHAQVDTAEGHLVVSIKADDQAGANEVYARASRLVQPPPPAGPSADR